MTDGRCKFGPRAKREMIERWSAGESARSIARSMSCSPMTVTAARDRWLAATPSERETGAWCWPRRPVPKSCPWKLPADVEQQICQARARTNLGPMRLAAICGRHRSTIGRVLVRHGMSRRPKAPRQTFRRFEWSQPGALIHIDAFTIAKFDQPGHWATGDRTRRSRQVGKTVVIALLDDHSRVVYHELHNSENAINCAKVLCRGAVWMREQGLGPVEAVMSDNAKAYTSNAFQHELSQLGARHILIPPYTPRWNGKIERFFRTLNDEWARGRIWPNSTSRDRALSSWMRYYNRRRPHSAAGGRAPITRVQQVREQDT